MTEPGRSDEPMQLELLTTGNPTLPLYTYLHT